MIQTSSTRNRGVGVVVLLGLMVTALTSCGMVAFEPESDAAAITLRGATTSSGTEQASAFAEAASPANIKTVVVIGDSISTGYQTSVAQSWPNLLVQDFNSSGQAVTVVNAAENGAGYLVPGSEGLTFDEQAKSAVTADAAAVVVYGSENDIGEDLSLISEKVELTAANVREQAPDAKLIFVGPASYYSDVDPELLAIRDQIESGAQAIGAEFIDPIEEQWIMADRENLIGPDGDHPSVAGHVYLAQKFEAILAPLLDYSRPA